MSAEPDYSELTERARRMWGLGDYSKLARLLDGASRELVDACAISAGQEVLDVAAGNGNLAIRAAKEGARVVASDLVPQMIARGRERSRAEGVQVEWVEADVEQLPFADMRFDCVASAFGAFLAPRPQLAAREMFRVTRAGGAVGMTNWTPESFPGRYFDIAAEYVPRAPELPRPVEWGVEATVRDRLGGLAASLEMEQRSVRWEATSAEALWDLLEEAAPTQVAARQTLPAEDYAELRERLIELAREFNVATDGSLTIDVAYLLVVARKRG